MKLLLLTSFATVATAIAYGDANVARVALLTVSKVIFYCYRRCYDANCYYESDIARRVPGQTATLPLLLLKGFATIATAIAYADDSVARVALLRAVDVGVL